MKLELAPVDLGFASMSVAMAFPLVEVGLVVDAVAVGCFVLRDIGRKVFSPPGWVKLQYFGLGKQRRQTINLSVGVLTAASPAELVGVCCRLLACAIVVCLYCSSVSSRASLFS